MTEASAHESCANESERITEASHVRPVGDHCMCVTAGTGARTDTNSFDKPGARNVAAATTNSAG
ncbi:MAG: hypothetical protein ABJE10_07300 [bacterium]